MKKQRYRGVGPGRGIHRSAGFTMVELMVAMLLGLVVIAAAGSMFVAGQQNFRNNAALAEVQDNIRVAFELMARDIREAGYWGCNSAVPRVVNVMQNGPAASLIAAGGNQAGAYALPNAWWGNSDIPLRGYDAGLDAEPMKFGATAESRVAGTDGVVAIGATGQPLSINTMDAVTDTITLNETNANLRAGDAIVICDPSQASIVQISSASGNTLKYDGAGMTPGNCSTGLGFPTDCAALNLYPYSGSSALSRFGVAGWYVGFNGGPDPARDRSLYRVTVENDGAGNLEVRPNEIVRGVTDMTILYRSPGDVQFIDGASRNDPGGNIMEQWGETEAVQVTLTLESRDQRPGTTDSQPIERTFTNVITLRNRVN